MPGRAIAIAGTALFGSVLIGALVLGGRAAPPTAKLVSGDFGLYGSAWMPWLRNNEQAFDFLIYQVGPTRKAATVVDDLQFASDIDLPVVLTIKVKFEAGDRQSPATGDTTLRPFTRILDAVDTLPLVGVTIGEENTHWDGRAEQLSAWFNELKHRYPARNFYQWYSPARKLNVPGGRWPNLPADGWVFDQYPMQPETYRRYVEEISALQKPLVSVVWASPFWQPGEQRPENASTWWQQQGWRQFYEQVRINLERQVPTAFFPYDLEQVDAKRPLPLFRSERSCAGEFLHHLVNVTLPFLRGVERLPELPETRPDWIPSAC